MSRASDILAAADRCVMCGLCLPHCPTYRLLRNEADSPRGRIALMQAYANGQLDSSPALRTHLDRCLACRACERMCPSKVEYGKLIDTSRAKLDAPKPKSLKLLLESVADTRKLTRTAAAMRTYQRSGLQRLTRKSGILKGLDLDSLEALLPDIPDAVKLEHYYPPTAPPRGEVGLFIGCIGSVMEGEIHLAAIRLLNFIGYAVHIPGQQGCCGSLHQHNGEVQTAERLAEANIHAFSGKNLDAVISTASGCAAQLFEYPALYDKSLPAPLYEVCDFLQRYWPDGTPEPEPQHLRATLHLPCTQRNTLRRPDAVAQLLRRIPGLELQELGGNDQCCGAAGSYMLTQPEIADTLRQTKISAAKAQQATLLLSNNLGCALHIAAGMEIEEADIKVEHPVLFLARSLNLFREK